MTETNETKLDLLETKSQYEKFVIYLPSKFFNASIFKNIYQRIRKKLRYKGIMTYDIDEYAKNLIRHNNYCNSIKDNLLNIASEFEYQPDVSINNLLKNTFGDQFIGRKFDDLDYPSANVLYIHLYGGYYYNDKIYTKKKFDLERELLFFIAGNLGVGKITYTITNKETIITKIKSDANIQNIKNQIQFSKTHTEKECTECTEIYENNGAAILFDANGDIKKLEREIKKSLEPINSPIFNYGFYKSNPKMVAFVCKRFLFTMNTLDYTSESEDVSEMSLTVQSCFADYGLQIAFESSTTITEKVTYKLEFHNENNLLETYFQKKKYNDSASDQFIMIRKFYDEDKSSNKVDSKNMIKKYIIGLADKCEYRVKSTLETNTFSKKFDDFIKKSEVKLSIKFKNFYTTRDIKKWFVDNLLIRNKEEVSDDFFDNSEYKTNSNKIATTDLISSNSEKKYEEQIASLENQLKTTMETLNTYKIENKALLEQLELNSYSGNIANHNSSIQQSNESLCAAQNNSYFSTPQARVITQCQSNIDPINMEPQPTTQLIIHTHSPITSLANSNNSLLSIANTINTVNTINTICNDDIQKTKESNHEIQVNKTIDQLLKDNREELNHYKKLNNNIKIIKNDIKNKKEAIEEYKNANKDKMTENLIEFSSSQNSLQSLRSRKVMEQIKLTSSNKDLEEEQDAFDKLKCIFSRSNATMINIDKQICKTTDKCKRLEEEIEFNKHELKIKQDEIEQLTSKYEEALDEKSNLEQKLIEYGFSTEYLIDMLEYNKTQASNSINEIDEPEINYESFQDTHKLNNLSRTFSNSNKKENITISSV